MTDQPQMITEDGLAARSQQVQAYVAETLKDILPFNDATEALFGPVYKVAFKDPKTGRYYKYGTENQSRPYNCGAIFTNWCSYDEYVFRGFQLDDVIFSPDRNWFWITAVPGTSNQHYIYRNESLTERVSAGSNFSGYRDTFIIEDISEDPNIPTLPLGTSVLMTTSSFFNGDITPSRDTDTTQSFIAGSMQFEELPNKVARLILNEHDELKYDCCKGGRMSTQLTETLCNQTTFKKTASGATIECDIFVENDYCASPVKVSRLDECACSKNVPLEKPLQQEVQNSDQWPKESRVCIDAKCRNAEIAYQTQEIKETAQLCENICIMIQNATNNGDFGNAAIVGSTQSMTCGGTEGSTITIENNGTVPEGGTIDIDTPPIDFTDGGEVVPSDVNAESRVFDTRVIGIILTFVGLAAAIVGLVLAIKKSPGGKWLLIIGGLVFIGGLVWWLTGNPCKNGGILTIAASGDKVCQCLPSNKGRKCESFLICQNGGTPDPSDGHCICAPGFFGKECEKPIPL